MFLKLELVELARFAVDAELLTFEHLPNGVRPRTPHRFVETSFDPSAGVAARRDGIPVVAPRRDYLHAASCFSQKLRPRTARASLRGADKLFEVVCELTALTSEALQYLGSPAVDELALVLQRAFVIHAGSH
jgi:hypothetical protein